MFSKDMSPLLKGLYFSPTNLSLLTDMKNDILCILMFLIQCSALVGGPIILEALAFS